MLGGIKVSERRAPRPRNAARQRGGAGTRAQQTRACAAELRVVVRSPGPRTGAARRHRPRDPNRLYEPRRRPRAAFTFLYEVYGYTRSPTFAILMLMKLFTLLSTLCACGAMLSAQDTAQSPAKKASYVSTIGEVVTIDAAAKQVKVKTDKGEEVTIALQDQTSYLRMPPGEKELSKATRIELKDVGVGDRVLARTRTLEGGGMSPAASLIIMTKTDLAEFHEKSRAEWEKRGTVGTVASVDPASKTIVVTVPNGLTPKDTKNVTLDPTDKVVYRRNPPGTWKFEDAKASSLAEIKVRGVLPRPGR